MNTLYSFQKNEMLYNKTTKFLAFSERVEKYFYSRNAVCLRMPLVFNFHRWPYLKGDNIREHIVVSIGKYRGVSARPYQYLVVCLSISVNVSV